MRLENVYEFQSLQLRRLVGAHPRDALRLCGWRDFRYIHRVVVSRGDLDGDSVRRRAFLPGAAGDHRVCVVAVDPSPRPIRVIDDGDTVGAWAVFAVWRRYGHRSVRARAVRPG